jgi:hypothetical protein
LSQDQQQPEDTAQQKPRREEEYQRGQAERGQQKEKKGIKKRESSDNFKDFCKDKART